MSALSGANGFSEKRPRSFGIGNFLFALLFALIVHLLISNVVRYHFFRAGHPSRSAAYGVPSDSYER